MKQRLGLVIVLITLFCIPVIPSSVQHTNHLISEDLGFNTSQSTPHDAIVITHNDNFTTQGWQGNGSVDNPFMISDLIITSDDVCVNISNTDVHFVIENCYLTSDGTTPSGYAIRMESVLNGEIHNVFITRKEVGIDVLDAENTLFSNITIYDTNLGINLSESTDCSIVNSTINRNSVGPGITLYESDHCDVFNNQLQGNPVGLLSNSSEWITITNNTIVGNSNFGIQSTSGTKKLSVYWNRIGWNGQNAMDNGSTKFWDNNNYGNWWSDGENDTDYLIPGTANGKDRHPQVWIDNQGPDINAQITQSESGGEYSVSISAGVIDNVAVNSVILSTSLDDGSTWTNVTMDWNYSTWVFDVDNLLVSSTIQYIVYANDYADNWGQTLSDTYTITSETSSSTTTSTTSTETNTDTSGTETNTNNTSGAEISIDPLLIAAIIGGVAIFSILAFLLYQYPSKFKRNN